MLSIATEWNFSRVPSSWENCGKQNVRNLEPVFGLYALGYCGDINSWYLNSTPKQIPPSYPHFLSLCTSMALPPSCEWASPVIGPIYHQCKGHVCVNCPSTFSNTHVTILPYLSKLWPDNNVIYVRYLYIIDKRVDHWLASDLCCLSSWEESLSD